MVIYSFFLANQLSDGKREHATGVFAIAELENGIPIMCKHQQQFGLDVQCSALVLCFYNIF